MPLSGRSAPPPFPIEALLPGPARAMVEALAAQYAVPSDLPASAWLALAGGCAVAGGTRRVEIDDGWSEQLTIYALVAAPSGSNKSGVFRALAAPVQAHERELQRRAMPEIAERRTAREAKKKKLERLKGDDESLREAQALAVQLAEEPEPAEPRLLTDDTTAEALANLMAAQGGRIMLASPECDLIGTLKGRYTDKGGTNLAVFLKGDGGEQIIVDRVNRPTLRIDEPALSLVLCGQPHALGTFLADPVLSGRGLVNRFIYAVPPSTLGSRPIDRPPIPPGVAEAYGAMMLGLLTADQTPTLPPEWADAGGGGGGTNPGSRTVRFTPKALEPLRTLRQEIEPTMGEGGAFEHASGWASKLAGTVAKIGAILALAECPRTAIVDVRHVEAACRIGWWAAAHAEIAFDVARVNPDVAVARRLIAWLRRTGSETFTGREALQALKGSGGRVQSMADLAKGLDMLADHGWIRRLDPEDHGRPKAASVYMAHPRIADFPTE